MTKINCLLIFHLCFFKSETRIINKSMKIIFFTIFDFFLYLWQAIWIFFCKKLIYYQKIFNYNILNVHCYTYNNYILMITYRSTFLSSKEQIFSFISEGLSVRHFSSDFCKCLKNHYIWLIAAVLSLFRSWLSKHWLVGICNDRGKIKKIVDTT